MRAVLRILGLAVAVVAAIVFHARVGQAAAALVALLRRVLAFWQVHEKTLTAGTNIFWFVFYLVFFTVVAAPLLVRLVFFVYRELTGKSWIIDPLSVPKEFADAGLTGEVFRSRIRDRLSEITAVRLNFFDGD
jgi:hypothetical protein